MAFVSWAAEYAKWQNAVAAMTTSQMIQSGYTTADGQTTTFKKLSDLTDYGNYLKTKADVEAQGSKGRTVFVPLGFGGL